MPEPRLVAPFCHPVLVDEDKPPRDTNALVELLPASRRTSSDDLVASTSTSIGDFIDAELDLRRLTDVHDHLWIAGRPMPPHPLHYQRLLGRELVITERLDHHLVWGNGRMFIKPLPRFLLEPRFWEKHLSCGPTPGPVATAQPGRCRGRCGRRRALGFLFSYAALIAYESDFQIAKQHYLIPADITWDEWKPVVSEVLGRENIYSLIDPRFHYGELRLSRLNKIYFFWKTPLRSYMSRWSQYSSFFGHNFTLLAGSTAYIAVVLTAMQVGLATRLQQSKAFESASCGFAIFSIVAPLITASLILAAFLYLFLDNWFATKRYNISRMQRIHARC